MATRRRRNTHSVGQLIRRRRAMRWGFAVLLGLLGGSAILDRGGSFKYRGDDWANFDHQACTVTAVADGDTLTLRPVDGGVETRVRLLGIDAPEKHDKRTGKPAYWSDRSTSYLTARAKGKSLTARLEPTQTRDKYGRLLAYLYLGDNENLNLSIIRDGYAYADRRFAHTMRPQFEQVENDARSKGRGLWRDVTEEEMPEWRQRWLSELRTAKAKR